MNEVCMCVCACVILYVVHVYYDCVFLELHNNLLITLFDHTLKSTISLSLSHIQQCMAE